eukprot:SAG31_NODE_20508_length_572_cov_1.410148_1_plen_34_part_10
MQPWSATALPPTELGQQSACRTCQPAALNSYSMQ